MMKMEKREQIHRFMDKFMRLQQVMRRHHRQGKKMRFLLISVHEMNEGKAFTTTQLAQKMDVTNAASSQMVDQLVKTGWVERIDDESDRRITWVHLTQAGKQELRLAYSEAAEFIEGMIEYLGEEDSQQIEVIMDKLLQYALNVKKKD